jgi:sec-independent protein translocase protein TatB
MFDIGFLELVLLSVVALVVLGPEKLPGAIRTVSLWIGRLRRSFNSIKQDIEKEIGADEIRRQLRNEAIMEKFKQTKTQVNDAVNTIRKETDEIRKNVEMEAQAAALTSHPPKPAETAAPSSASPAPATAQEAAATTTSPAAETTAASAGAEAPASKTEP